MQNHDCRYETFSKLPTNTVYFKSDYWHRVRPVSDGVRKSMSWLGSRNPKMK